MRADFGSSVSPWEAVEPRFHPLRENLIADVCIVGAGIAGLSCAYQLSCRGKNVVVVDRDEVGSGETGRTTAHLADAMDDRYFEIERLHGVQGARLAAQSHGQAIDTLEGIVKREGLDCEFIRVDGYLFNPPGQSPENLRAECEAARRAGLGNVEMVDQAPIPGFDSGPALRFPNQAQLDPTKYLAGLVGVLESQGVRIFTQTRVREVEGGSSTIVRTEGGFEVSAEATIVATNTPFHETWGVHTKQAAYRTYAIAAEISEGQFPEGLFWDTESPYHYVRRQAHPGKEGSFLLLVGGEDHKTGQETNPEERYVRLEDWSRRRFPGMGPVRYRWSGQVMEPVDGLAFIGPDPAGEPNVFIVSGDSGMGMTHGVIAGILLTALISGRDHPWLKLYDPSRKSLRSLGTFLKENLNAAWQFGDWLSGGDVDELSEIEPGEGAVCRQGLSKAAVYRDKEGNYFACTAACSHLGAVVRWNPAEKTWDCPAHGSRFDPYGRVLHGPAEQNLSAVPFNFENGGKHEKCNTHRIDAHHGMGDRSVGGKFRSQSGAGSGQLGRQRPRHEERASDPGKPIGKGRGPDLDPKNSPSVDSRRRSLRDREKRQNHHH